MNICSIFYEIRKYIVLQSTMWNISKTFKSTALQNMTKIVTLKHNANNFTESKEIRPEGHTEKLNLNNISKFDFLTSVISQGCDIRGHWI